MGQYWKNKATTHDGRSIEYLPDLIGEGGEKKVYFTSDKSSVIAFFKDLKDANDPERFNRLLSILGKFNPTLDPRTGEYWKNLFCWPTGIVTKPQLGVIAPAYPSNFFFKDGKGEKSGKWFSSPIVRKKLSPSERGNWLTYLQICILIARAVRKLHSSGLAHSDLSCKNVLVDPPAANCIIIDIDSLVVPGIHPPKVIGTPGYIAPEVLSGNALPSIKTDLHALAVLIYEYLLLRHPLRGPKVNSTISAEEDERLSMGEKALFIEHPTDRSNHPKHIKIPYTMTGPYISEMIKKTFVDGLHFPDERPTALDWERALVRTTDLLIQCHGNSCEAKWFVWDSTNRPVCPHCGWSYSGIIPILYFYSERRPGQYISDRHNMIIWGNGQNLYEYHVFNNIWPGENKKRISRGYFIYHEKKWYLVNNSSEPMFVINGSVVPSGKYVELNDNLQIKLSASPRGRLAVIQLRRC